jgi:hypothetical protein
MGSPNITSVTSVIRRVMPYDLEVLALTATVAEMRDTIKSLTAQNGGLRNEPLYKRRTRS